MTEFTGTDDTGAVTVVVDSAGTVTDVAVGENWRETVGARALGDALCTAANNALADRTEHAGAAPEPWAVAGRHVPDAGGDPSSEVARNLVNEVMELLAVFDRDLAAYRDRLRETVEVTGSGRGGSNAIEVTMSPGHVSAVTVDQGWATRARHTHVRLEAVGAFQAAGRQAGTGDQNTVPVPASIARLRELAGDPVALCTQLGLS